MLTEDVDEGFLGILEHGAIVERDQAAEPFAVDADPVEALTELEDDQARKDHFAAVVATKPVTDSVTESDGAMASILRRWLAARFLAVGKNSHSWSSSSQRACGSRSRMRRKESRSSQPGAQ